jgi:hypothetical protein
MAIIQISKIQQRSGNLVDLPQLDEAQFGWATDAKKLFIGKTTGNIENIEVLTSYSNISFSQIDGSDGGNFNISNATNGQILTYVELTNTWENWTGNASQLSNSKIQLGDVSNISIEGGATGYVLETDGVGNLAWTSKGTLRSAIYGLSNATPIIMTVENTTPYTNKLPVTISGANADNANSIVNGQTFFVKLSVDFPTTGNVELYTSSNLDMANAAVGTGLNNYVSNSGIATALLSAGVVPNAGGSVNTIQFNNSGILDGSANFTFSGGNLVTLNGNLIAGNVNGGNLVSANYVSGVLTTASQPNITATGVLANLSISGNINVGDINVSGNIIPTANVTYNLGNSTNAFKDLYLSGTSISLGTQTITSNVNGVILSNTVFASALSITGNADIGNINTSGTISSTGTATVGNLSTGGTITSTGTATVGNLTTSGTITSTGTATVGNLTTGGTITSTGNIAGGNLTTNGNVTANNISATGNVTAANFIGSGNGSPTINSASTLTISANSGVTLGNVTILSTGSNTTAGTIVGNWTLDGSFNASGNLGTSGNLSSTGNLNITGNMTIATSPVLNSKFGVISSGRLLGVYTNRVGIGSYYADYNGTNDITSADATSVSRLGTILDTGIASSNTSVAFGTSYGSNPAGLAFVSGTAQDVLRIATGLPPTYTGNINAVLLGYPSGGPRILVQNYALVDDSPNTITHVATTHKFVGELSTTNITTGANTTAGSLTGNWTLTAGSQLQATYADLAEYYEADATYEPGTVLEFGGLKEVTLAEDETTKVAGVVSTNPAYVMNTNCKGFAVAIALQGRVPVKVKGNIKKGDMMVSAGDGFARPTNSPKLGTIIGKALADFNGIEGIIEIAVGRL